MNIPQLFFSKAAELEDKKALIWKEPASGRWLSLSWNSFARQVSSLTAHLLSQAFEKGERVALLSENRPQWAIADLAILAAGGINVPLYFTSTSNQIEHIIRDSGARRMIVSTCDQLEKVLNSKCMDDIHEIILFDKTNRALPGKVKFLTDILDSHSAEDHDLIKERINETGAHHTASILYTSGTTGPPKGVVLSHNNFISNANASAEVINVTGNDLLLSFLPLSHAFERTAGYYVPLFMGASIAYAESVDKIAANMLEIKPTIMLGVPRFYEKTYAAVREKIDSLSPFKKQIFQWSLAVGQACSERELNKEQLSPFLKLKRSIAGKLVFKPLKEGLGGRIRFFVSGGAPLSKDITAFFEAAGIVILEGYGLTETSPVITCNRLEWRKRGSVGRALPGLEVKIKTDGEVITRGPHVMQGYFNKPEKTREVIREGWFYTGDIGEIDEDGFLTITDRKKDIIVTSGGKNVAPQTIETALVSNPLISQVMVYGDRKKYITALIVPDFAKLEELAKREKISHESLEALCGNEKIIHIYLQITQKVLKNFAPFEQVKKVLLAGEEFSMAKGEITPTLKVKRKALIEKYGKHLDVLYDE
ncbi:MAG: long-chain fatty acid--CoA ligase [Deltaproteobacteria bacterium]|nr:long-chain fatty acid--CoA ligase [Deltaproteobacteria bacterium]